MSRDDEPSFFQIAKGVLKALFTTSPFKPVRVEVYKDGRVEIKDLRERDSHQPAA